MKIKDEIIQQMIHAYREASEKMERELHAPSEAFPDGFYCKEDRDIMATVGMESAAQVLASALLPNSQFGEPLPSPAKSPTQSVNRDS